MTVRLTGNSDSQSGGQFTSSSELIVYGTLDAQGVTFESADGGKWGGIVLEGDGVPQTTSSVIEGCRIEDAYYGTLVRVNGWTAGGTTESTGNEYWACTYGVYFDALPAGGHQSGVRNSKMEVNTTGVFVDGATEITIDHNLIWNNSAYGVDVNSGSQDVLIDHVDIDYFLYNVATGIRFQGSSTGTVSNTNVTSANCGSLQADPQPSVTVSYFLWSPNRNSVCGWQELDDASPGTRRGISSQPRYASGGSDHTLQSTAPGLDLGDPAQTDPDGSRLDIGRYGGTSSAGTATGTLQMEDYFYLGQTGGWTPASGTSGSWSGDSGQGTYKATGVNGISRSWKSAGASSYTIEARLKFSGSEGKVLFHDADGGEDYRLDLMASDNARLKVGGTPIPGPMTIDPNTWYSVRLEVAGGKVNVWVDTTQIHQDVPMGVTPDGVVGVGSYGGTHTVEFDYVVVMNGDGSGGGNFLVDDPFDDGSTSGWSPHGGTWTETGGVYRGSYGGETWSHYTSGLGVDHYTVKARLRLTSGAEGKVVYKEAGSSPGKRVDVMASDRVRLVTAVKPDSWCGWTINHNTWYDIEVEVDGPANKGSVWVDGSLCVSNHSMSTGADGFIGVGVYSSTTEFDYIQAYAGARSGKPVATRLEVPAQYRLSPNYPNPFNPGTTIRYEVPVPGAVRVEVYNLLGQRIRTLVDGAHEVGRYEAVWDGRDDAGRQVTAGVYVHRLVAEGYLEARKMTLLR